MLVVAILALLGTSSGQPGPLEAGAAEVVAEASRALEGGDARAAFRLLDPIARDPGIGALGPGLRREALVTHGLAAAAIEDPEAAAASLEAAVEVPGGGGPPENAVLALARARIEMEDGGGARRALERLPREALERPAASEILGLAFYQDGDLRRAEAAFVAALRAGPSAQAAFHLGVIRHDRGDHEAALESFGEALRLDPGNYYGRVYRARSLLELGRLDGAAGALEPLASRGGAPAPEVRYLLGRTRLRQGRLEDAARLFGEALAANPGYGEAIFGLGTVLRRLGRTAEARDALGRFEALQRAEAERLRKADGLAQAALRSPGDAAATEAAARFALETGDHAAAGRHAWRSLRLEPSRASARITLARALAASGRYGAAAVQYQRILKEHPGEADARRELEDLVRRHAKGRR